MLHVPFFFFFSLLELFIHIPNIYLQLLHITEFLYHTFIYNTVVFSVFKTKKNKKEQVIITTNLKDSLSVGTFKFQPSLHLLGFSKKKKKNPPNNIFATRSPIICLYLDPASFANIAYSSVQNFALNFSRCRASATHRGTTAACFDKTLQLYNGPWQTKYFVILLQ